MYTNFILEKKKFETEECMTKNQKTHEKFKRKLEQISRLAVGHSPAYYQSFRPPFPVYQRTWSVEKFKKLFYIVK